MMSTLARMLACRQMLACRWARRRIQRYLDADPAYPLTDAETRRLRRHLAVCEGCSAVEWDYLGLAATLGAWSAARGPDPGAAARVRSAAEQMISDQAR